MRADSFSTVPQDARGRDSVRISSYDAYADSVIVLDLAHMPEGCGTWPAFWTLSHKGPWPNGGEIDIVEGMSHGLREFIIQDIHPCNRCQPQSSESCLTSHNPIVYDATKSRSDRVSIRLPPLLRAT